MKFEAKIKNKEGQKLEQETHAWDSEKGVTFLLRKKRDRGRLWIYP